MKTAIPVVLLIFSALLILYLFNDSISFERLKLQNVELQKLLSENPVVFISALSLSLVIASSLPVPFVAVLSIAAGALLGFVQGLFIVTLSCSIGALLAFTYIRFLASDKIITLFTDRSNAIQVELMRAPFIYSSCLRCLPGMPFFVGNAILALSPISISVFVRSTVIGMLPTFVTLTLAGSRLHRFESIRDIIGIDFVIIMLIAIGLLMCMRLAIKNPSPRT